MKRISFDKRFINNEGNDLIPGKIHTIRKNYDFWKRFEGKEVALFVWEDKPYQSKQKVFCVKKLYHVQKLFFTNQWGLLWHISVEGMREQIARETFVKNDGFHNFDEVLDWFHDYPTGEMGILHFTNFRY